MSDGSEKGTLLVQDIMPGSKTSNPENLVDVKGVLFFSANNGQHGNELWKYTPDSLAIAPLDLETVCANSLIHFTTTTFGFSPTRYTWSSEPAGINGSGTTVSFTAPRVSTVTTYSLTISATDGNLTRTAGTTFVINAQPSFSIVAPATTVCTGSSLRLAAVVSGNSGSPTFNWFGSTAVSHLQPATASTVRVTPVQTGLHTMTLIVTDRGCSATDLVSFTAHPPPSELAARVSGQLSLIKSTVVIAATAREATQYTLSGPASSTTNKSGNFLVSQPGVYTVTAVAEPTGCSSSTVVVVQRLQPPLIKQLRAETKGASGFNVSGKVRGVAYILTGPGGYVFSNVYRVEGDNPVSASNLTRPGQYTLTVYGGDGKQVREVIKVSAPVKQLLLKSTGKNKNGH